MTTSRTVRTPRCSSSTCRTASSPAPTGATRSSPTSAAWSTRRAREQVPVVWVQHADDELRVGQRRVADRPRAGTRRRRAARRTSSYGDSFEDTRSRPCSPTSASGASSSSAPRPTHASARRCTARSPAATTPRSSATPTRPRTIRVGRAAARPGHRPHQPLLERADRARPHGRHRRDRRRRPHRFRRHLLTRARHTGARTGR